MKLIPILGEEIEINSKEKINKSLEVSENVHKSFFRSNKKPRPYLGEEFNPSFGDKFVKSLNVVTYSQKQPGCGDIIYKSECGETNGRVITLPMDDHYFGGRGLLSYQPGGYFHLGEYILENELNSISSGFISLEKFNMTLCETKTVAWPTDDCEYCKQNVNLKLVGFSDDKKAALMELTKGDGDGCSKSYSIEKEIFDYGNLTISNSGKYSFRIKNIGEEWIFGVRIVRTYNDLSLPTQITYHLGGIVPENGSMNYHMEESNEDQLDKIIVTILENEGAYLKFIKKEQFDPVYTACTDSSFVFDA